MLELLKIMDFEKNALIPVIVQDADTRTVLMLGYMDKEALERTVATRRVTFFSRRRRRLWTKGETSGNFLQVQKLSVDCDRDTLLAEVTPEGPVCHLGTDTCFGTRNQGDFIRRLENTIGERRQHPRPGSYCAKLFSRGRERIAKKFGEEAAEVIIAALGKENDREFLSESADLLFHLLLLLAVRGKKYDDVLRTLRSRHRGDP